MSKLRAFFFLLGAALWAACMTCSAFALTNIKLPVPELETLPNGLQLVWFVNDTLPVVDLSLLVKSGYRDDPVGKTGTAELLVSSLDRGAGGMTAQQIARAVEMLGASRFSVADDDVLTIGMHGLALDAERLLEMLARLALLPDFLEAEVAREHARLLDRWNHIGDSGDTLASLAYRRTLSNGTTYARGGFFSASEFINVSRKDVVEFYKRHFTPDNSVLMIVGRVNKDDFRKQILSAFGQWSGKVPKKTWKNHSYPKFESKRGQVILVDRPGLTQAQVRIGFRASLVKSPHHYPLVLTNAFLGEYFNSRLNSLIRDKLGLTYGIGSSFSYSKDFAAFTISSATSNESTGQLIRKVLDVLVDLRRGSVGADEVQMAKDYLIGGFPLGVASLGSVALRWLTGHVLELGPTYLSEFVPKVQAVTHAQVVSAVKNEFDLNRVVIVVAGDGKEVSKSLGAGGFRNIKRVLIRDLQ